mmetsp:Transcript_6058/g.22172  ORF Transcript_6058/g.22172 Transcript_6058/m.22172 type:complete len:121 (+) Transcript_6058:2308-2670(+)
MEATLPLTGSEYEEWGDPRSEEGLASMRMWCPYATLGRLPNGTGATAVLVATALNDPRVPAWGTLKWVCRLRSRHEETNAPPVLFTTEGIRGHLVDDMSEASLDHSATEYAFLFKALGMA